MRAMGAALIAVVMTASGALADGAVPAPAPAAAATGPLAAGKPAGVKQADIETGGVLLWGGIALAAGAIAIIASNTQGKSGSSTTTTH